MRSQHGLSWPKGLPLSPSCKVGEVQGLGLGSLCARAGDGTVRRENTNEIFRGSLQGKSSGHQPNSVIASFYTGSCSQFKGKDALFRASSFPATVPNLPVTCPWLCDGCAFPHAPIFFCSVCSIIPDQRPSGMSPSCKDGLIIQ